MKVLIPAIALFISSLSISAQATEYFLGVVPQQSPVTLFKAWKPVTDYLSETTGLKVGLKTEKSIAEFEKVLYDGGYDISYMNPFHYTLANERQNYQVVARAKKTLKGIMVMQKGGDFKALVTDPKTMFLFPSPNAFAATLIVKYELLTEFGVDLNKSKNFKYVNSHDSVYKGIARDIGQLGGGIQRTFNNFSSARDKDKLVEVYETKAYPSHPFAVKSTMPEADREKLVAALLAMPAELSERLSMKEIIATDDAEFDVIRELASKLDTVNRD